MTYEFRHKKTGKIKLVVCPMSAPTPKPPRGYVRVYEAAIFAEGKLRNEALK